MVFNKTTVGSPLTFLHALDHKKLLLKQCNNERTHFNLHFITSVFCSLTTDMQGAKNNCIPSIKKCIEYCIALQMKCVPVLEIIQSLKL